MTKALDPTTKAMRRMYLPPRNLSLEEIGKEFGVSRQAVHKRLTKAGVELRGPTGARMARYEAWAAKATRKIDRALTDTRDHDELAKLLDVPVTWIRRYLQARFGTVDLRPQERHHRGEAPGWLQEAARAAQGPLTAGLYDEHRPPGAISASAVIARYGTWTAACEAAGVACVAPQPGRVYRLRWTPDDTRTAVAEYARECADRGTRPKAIEYDRVWRPAHECPSLGIIRRHFGSWRDALWAAMR